MNIDISNAHCGPRIQFPDHAWLRVVYVPKDCLRQCRSCENDERRETCVSSHSRGRDGVLWGAVESLSAAPSAAVWTDHDAAAPDARFSLERARRARILSD